MNFKTKGLFLLALFSGLAFATSNIVAGLCELYVLVNTVLTVVIFLLIVAAAVVYAGGQLLGAETRARASVWATSMFIGALIGVLIYIIMPMILGIMYSGAAASASDFASACASYSP